MPVEGTISTIGLLDKDDEGIVKELVVFDADFTATTDNSAFAPSDDDLLNCIGVISIDVFYNYSVNQVGFVTPAFSYVAPNGYLYCQLVTRGVDNIAAGSIPRLFGTIV